MGGAVLMHPHVTLWHARHKFTLHIFFFIEDTHYSGSLIQVLQGSEQFKLHVETHHKMVGMKSMSMPGLV
jgi:hypothetical protein